MGFNLLSWLLKKTGKTEIGLNDTIGDLIDLAGDVYIKEMAFWSTVNVIANAVSKCEFKTFVKGKETRGNEYYLWNIQPNRNQNSSEFLNRLVAKLYRDNECLVIEQNDQLLIADSFIVREYALYDNLFSQVAVGDFVFEKTFNQSEVMHFKLSETNLKEICDGIYTSYQKLIAYSMKAYRRSRGTKGTFNYDTVPEVGAGRAAWDKLWGGEIKKWLEGDNGALPLGRGQSWNELTKRTYSEETSRDIRAMIDDVSDFYAKALGVPPALVRGDVQGVSDAVDQLLTFCIDPLVDKLSEEINRKRYSRMEYLSGTHIQIDTLNIKHIDLLSVAASVDKLIASGAFSINDIRKRVGEAPIDEPWADEHFMTRNYTRAGESLTLVGKEENRE